MKRVRAIGRQLQSGTMGKRRAGDVLCDEGGSAAVEFGMIAGPFIALALAILQSGLTLFVSQGLDTAVQEAGRMIMTGQVHSSGGVTSPAQFRDRYICNPPAPATRTLPVFMDCGKIVIDIQTAASFSGAGAAPFDTGNLQACIGGPGQVVIVRAVYHSPVFAPFLALNGFLATGRLTAGQVQIDGEMRYALTAATAFRNEPFGGTSSC